MSAKSCLVKLQQENPNLSLPILAIASLLEFVKESKAQTMVEFMTSIKTASEEIKALPNSVSIKAGCDLFMRYIANNAQDSTVNISD
jgi:translation initiation factor eIF-2B subunit alpha